MTSRCMTVFRRSSKGMGMTETETFVLADRALNGVVQQIRDDQWDMPMPADFARRDTAEVPSLRTIIGYHAYDDAWVPDMLAGRSNVNAASDLGVASLLADAAAHGAAANVLVNLPSVGDDAFAAEMSARVERLLADVGSTARRVREVVASGEARASLPTSNP